MHVLRIWLLWAIFPLASGFLAPQLTAVRLTTRHSNHIVAQLRPDATQTQWKSLAQKPNRCRGPGPVGSRVRPLQMSPDADSQRESEDNGGDKTLPEAEGQGMKEEFPAVSSLQYLWFMVAFPALSAVFPTIVEAAQQTSVPEDRRVLIILFLILKRVYLYCAALSIVDIAARRAASVPLELGQRLKQLNEELLASVVSEEQMQEITKGEMAQEAYESLNQVDAKDQAIFLPLFLGSALLGSFALIQFQSLPEPSTAAVGSSEMIEALKSFTKVVGPYVGALSNAAVCVLFTRSEFVSALKSFLPSKSASDLQELQAPPEDISDKVGTALSVAAVVGCYIGPASLVWPLRNLVNSCLAITAARAIQLPKFSYVAAALGGLVAYDTIGVYGSGLLLPSAGAAEPASVMESVARSKLEGSQFWQPGLLSVVISGKTTDALGLADAVFPTLLAGWAMRYNQKDREEPGPPRSSWCAKSALGGYALGCFLSEVFNNGGGQPALLFLVPSMMVAVLGSAASRGELGKVLRS